jgi:deoxyribonucleoside regulator
LNLKIVQISINDPYQNSSDLSTKLKKALGLKNCIVVSGQIIDASVARRNIALATARYFAEVIQPDDIIGIGWGRTLFEIAEVVEPKKIKNVIFVPLLGGIGQIDPSFQVHNITHKISENFNGTWMQYHVPGIVENSEIREQLQMTNNVREILLMWETLSLVLVGIGEEPLGSEIIFQDNVSDIEKIKLIEKGAVGDICMSFFDKNGKPVPYMQQKNMSVEMETLIRVPEVIAVAVGSQKAKAIIGASRAKYIKTLITDELTALRILKELEE